MAKINVNLDDVDDSNLVSVGWHRVRVMEEEEKDSQNSEYSYINWRLEVSDPDDEDFKKSLFLITSLNPKALPMLKRFIKACEIEWDPDGFHTEDVLGSELMIMNKHREWEGEKQNNVTSYKPL